MNDECSYNLLMIFASLILISRSQSKRSRSYLLFCQENTTLSHSIDISVTAELQNIQASSLGITLYTRAYCRGIFRELGTIAGVSSDKVDVLPISCMPGVQGITDCEQALNTLQHIK